MIRTGPLGGGRSGEPVAVGFKYAADVAILIRAQFQSECAGGFETIVAITLC